MDKMKKKKARTLICLLCCVLAVPAWAQELKKGRIEVADGVQLYYEEMGEGQPVIFLHGHSLDYRMWDGQFFDFARRYRAIRYDMRGYGFSSPQTETQQFTHVEDLIRLMDALHIEQAHIVGLSMGGFVGADMLGWFPDRILTATLACGNVRTTPGPGTPMGKEESERRDREIAALKEKGVDVMKRDWFAGLMRSGGTQKARMREALWTMIDHWDAWQPLHKEVRVIAGADAFEKLQQHCPTVPVMILEARSENNRFSSSPKILEYLPNGCLEVIEDAGHMVNMERPEEFNKVVDDFIRRNTPPASLRGL